MTSARNSKTKGSTNARLAAAAPRMLALLRQMGHIIDMSDCEHAEFADSGADVVEALSQIASRVRRTVKKLG